MGSSLLAWNYFLKLLNCILELHFWGSIFFDTFLGNICVVWSMYRCIYRFWNVFSFFDSLSLYMPYGKSDGLSRFYCLRNCFFCSSDVLFNYRCNYKLLPRSKKVPLPLPASNIDSVLWTKSCFKDILKEKREIMK